MTNARFQSNGVDVLIDALAAAGEVPGDVRDYLWQAVWARSYQDVLVPLPMPDSKIDGFVVQSRRYSERSTLVLVDDGERLVGLLDEFRAVPLGAKVRIAPIYGVHSRWSLKVVATLGCGLQIRFDEGERVETGWIDRLRNCLLTVREAEFAVRRAIEARRRTLEFVAPPLPFRTEMESADKELRERVLAGGYTDDEKKMLAKAKTPEAVQRIIAVRNKRLVEAYRSEVVRFRATIPALRAAWDQKMEAYAEFRKAVDRCNEVDGSSRATTDASLKASEMLSTIETAALNVKAVSLDRVEDDPRANFHEIVQTIELLFDLLPKRFQRIAASAAS